MARRKTQKTKSRGKVAKRNARTSARRSKTKRTRGKRRTVSIKAGKARASVDFRGMHPTGGSLHYGESAKKEPE